MVRASARHFMGMYNFSYVMNDYTRTNEIHAKFNLMFIQVFND